MREPLPGPVEDELERAVGLRVLAVPPVRHAAGQQAHQVVLQGHSHQLSALLAHVREGGQHAAAAPLVVVVAVVAVLPQYEAGRHAELMQVLGLDEPGAALVEQLEEDLVTNQKRDDGGHNTTGNDLATTDLPLEAEVGAGDDAAVEEAGQVEGQRGGVEVLLGVGQGLVTVMISDEQKFEFAAKYV